MGPPYLNAVSLESLRGPGLAGRLTSSIKALDGGGRLCFSGLRFFFFLSLCSVCYAVPVPHILGVPPLWSFSSHSQMTDCSDSNVRCLVRINVICQKTTRSEFFFPLSVLAVNIITGGLFVQVLFVGFPQF